MPRMDLAFAQKILYGNSEVFVVPSTASYWLEWQEGFQTAVEQQLQQQLSTTGRDWTTGTELCMGLLPKAHLLWQSYSGRAYSMLKFAVLYMDASIVHSSYQCSGRQNTIHNDSCRWQWLMGHYTWSIYCYKAIQIVFLNHSPTYLPLSTMKYHIY